MKLIKTIIGFSVFLVFSGCSEDKLMDKGFSVSSPASEVGEKTNESSIAKDSLSFETAPGSVLLTGIPKYRLATIYKVNYKDDGISFVGSNEFYHNSLDSEGEDGNQWHYNYLPGIQAVYGYNMVNISHYDIEAQVQRNLFEKPVLIKTFYYPSFSKDTLNYKPISRNYYLVSVHDEDTDKDGSIRINDLRRFYYFDINAKNKRPLIPVSYSVFKSEYDPVNDLMYVFARLDKNGNGKIDKGEEVHIFWVDLKNPEKTGRQY